MCYQLDATGAIRDQSLTGDTIVLADDNCRALIRSTLTDGVLKLAQPKKAGGVVMSTLKNCLVDAVKPQRDSHFFTARFINCRFRGLFSGIDFGRGNRIELHEDFGVVKDCDFADAILDGCRFVDVDVSTLKFPRHDHAVLLDPCRRSADVGAIQWPGVLGKYMEICTSKPPSFKASVMHIPSLARLVHCTKEEIEAAFEKFGSVLM